MKIDKDTKMVVGGIAVLGAAYIVLKPKDDKVSGFGGGGFGGLPTVVEESTPEGDIIYNIPSPEMPKMDVEWDKDDTELTKKEGRALLEKEAGERGQFLVWDDSIPETVIPKITSEVSDTPTMIDNIVDPIINFIKLDSADKGIALRKGIYGTAVGYAEQRTESRLGELDLLGGLITGRRLGAVKSYKEFQHAAMSKKTARIRITKESEARNQRVIWDKPVRGYTASGKKMTRSQKSLSKEGSSRGQITVWD